MRMKKNSTRDTRKSRTAVKGVGKKLAGNRHTATTRARKQAAVKQAPMKQAAVKRAPMKQVAAKVSRGFRESPEERQARALRIVKILGDEFPEARTALLHRSPFQLLIATILSAQCTDERVNIVTPILFDRYKQPSDFDAADPAELEGIIRSTGFFRMKAKNIIACARELEERFGGVVPPRMEDLVTLPGVGRKTANVALGQAFGIASGVVVDTHVFRLAHRMGFSSEKTPEKVEADLMEAFPRGTWIEISSSLILHGRRTCPARTPKCDICPIAMLCPKL